MYVAAQRGAPRRSQTSSLESLVHAPRRLETSSTLQLLELACALHLHCDLIDGAMIQIKILDFATHECVHC